MPRALPLCPTCGAWQEPCGHPPDPRLQWVAEPLRRPLVELLGMALFTALFALVITGIGPLLWWLAYGWPPRDWLEWFGVIMVALVSLPGAVIGVGLIVSIPEHYPGRCWILRDRAPHEDDQRSGYVLVRRGRPTRGAVTRAVRTALPAPVSFDMTTETAAHATAELGHLLAVALAGLLARGHLDLTSVHETGWSRQPDEPPRPTDRVLYYARPRASPPPVHPWIERALLDVITTSPGDDLLRQLERLAHRVADTLGFAYDEDGHAPHWPEDATSTPAEALQARLLEDLDDTTPAPPVEPALAAWRAQHPDIAPLLERVSSVARSVLDPADP